ncbi:alpha/beta hydrolase [Pseudokineococcus marinus]|uniref:alpha/beta fold hydrolase n=1 Tax=Pseudokineococcus marinus TaxID=351215 RepID=UPI0030B2E04B
MSSGRDVAFADGRVLRVHDSGPPGAPGRGDGVTLVWYHGSPQTGALLEPGLATAAARGLHLVSSGRPGYGGSTPRPGRDVASAAEDVAAVAEALRLGRLVVVGASGGGPHALACAALLADRVVGAVSLAGLAPFRDERWWFDGMADEAALRAAARGRDARLRHAEHDAFDPSSFVDADWEALAGPWADLGADAQRAGAAGPGGLVDDDVAFTRDWGVDLADVRPPVLCVHGDRDRVVPPAHGRRLVDALPRGEVWTRPADGHVSVLAALPAALDRILAVAGR